MVEINRVWLNVDTNTNKITLPSATICNAAAAEPSTLWEPASGVRRSFGRWQTSERKTWTPGCGAGVEPIIHINRAKGGVTDVYQKILGQLYRRLG